MLTTIVLPAIFPGVKGLWDPPQYRDGPTRNAKESSTLRLDGNNTNGSLIQLYGILSRLKPPALRQIMQGGISSVLDRGRDSDVEKVG